MKKFFTLFAVAALAVSAYAQTPLTIGGGWNDGFVGEADVYEYQITSQWGAAEFYMDINPADYPTATLTFDGPCPTGFQANYTWGDAATPEYGVVAIEGETSATITFNPEHKNIKMVAVQHTTADAATLKIKKVVLNAADGTTLEVASAFTGWAGKDVSKTYKGTVKLNSQYMQLVISGATGMEGINVKIESPEPLPAGIQFCVDYEDGTSEWPQIAAGETTATVSTAEGKKIKNLGIQRQEAGAMTLTISGAYLMENSPETPEISFLDVQEGDITAESITVRWTPNDEITSINIDLGFMKQMTKLMEDEVKAGVYTIEMLNPDTEYTIWLSKFEEGKEIKYAEKVYKTAAKAAEISFLDVQEGDITAESITVRWTPNDEITAINIDLGFMKQMSFLMEDEIKAGVHTIEMLDPDTEYTIWLSKIVEGKEVKFAEKVYKTAAEAAEISFLDVQEGDITAESITVRWTPNDEITTIAIKLDFATEMTQLMEDEVKAGVYTISTRLLKPDTEYTIWLSRLEDGKEIKFAEKVYKTLAETTGISNIIAVDYEESYNLHGQKSNGNGFSVKGGKIYLKK